MEYTQLGRIGLTASRLCLGIMNFGLQTTEVVAFAIMDGALARLLANPVVTAPIIVPRTVEQLTGSLCALEIKFGKTEMMNLEEIWPDPCGEAYAW